MQNTTNNARPRANDPEATASPCDKHATGVGDRESRDSGGGGGEGREGGRKDAMGPQSPPTPPTTPDPTRAQREDKRWDEKLKAEGEGLASTARLMKSLELGDLSPKTWAVVADAWQRALDYVQTVKECREGDKSRIQTLETRNKELEAGLTRPKQVGGSWARVAASGTQTQGKPPPQMVAGGSLNGRGSMNMKKLDNSKMRRVTVQIRDEKEREAAKKADKEDLVKTFRNPANEATKDIVAAFTKPSGEVILVTATVEAREALEKRREWASIKYPSAEVRRQTFPVVVHGVRRAAINTERQTETIAKIVEANKVLHPGLQVDRVWWPASASRPGPSGYEKTASSLVLELVTPEEVNEVVRKGAGGGWKPPELRKVGEEACGPAVLQMLWIRALRSQLPKPVEVWNMFRRA
ncbi:MAG: hypothetical protein Q9212_007483 [Teloschistes hypoglaucus]